MEGPDIDEKTQILQARREARRQKILQNAGNRLKLITGTTEEPNKPDELFNLDAPVIDETDVKLVPAFFENYKNPNIDETVTLIPQKQSVTSVEDAKSSVARQSFNFLLIFASIVTCICSKVGFSSYSIIIPYILLEIMFVFMRDGKMNNIFQTFLLISNFNPHLVRKVMYVLSKFEFVIKDFCIYFFSFLICHVLCEFFVPM